MKRQKLTNKERKELIKKAMHEHILVDGVGDWDKLMADFPDISRPTFYRYLKEVREEIENQAGEISKEQLAFAQRRIRRDAPLPGEAVEEMKIHLPVAPSPAVVAADPLAAAKAFDFFKFFDGIVQDAELAREQNIKTGPDGNSRIINPAMFDRNMQRRLHILQTYLQSIETVYNMERIRELYDLIIEEVGKADVDVQQAVLARLRNLNNKRGLTMAAKP